MRRQCVGCHAYIKGHVLVKDNRDWCGYRCQRDTEVDPLERRREWNKKKQRWFVEVDHWYDRTIDKGGPVKRRKAGGVV